ncbi:ecto-ADP-ribosyltransferase 5 isoform X3 [Microcaecilia unicolor]|uniref:NAD(P)(+)--arginine ADP-ribosyltransferase n=1 Tax=Microcaecilia unicolor TaxID=1415580 RepID=A0A6P7XYC0_9AMPH|nr:ecto-ADP-ribosyltransferase 5-like isoform X3 [Microcaecilia unicolor]
MVMVSISIISASLYVLTLLGIPQVKCQIIDVVLDMAPTAFDDQYIGCEETMVEKMCSTNLLVAEKNKDVFFKESWENAVSEWRRMVEEKKLPPLPKGFSDEHGIALLVYTSSGTYHAFNVAVRIGGRSPEYYMQEFHFKVLHFYLTTALRLLRESCGPLCQTVYRGEYDIHFHPPTSSDKKMRFGQFTSTSTSKEVAKKFGKDSFFTLMTCFGVCVEKYSSFSYEQEVLLPVNEVFTVSSFDEQTHSFVLNSTRKTCSRYNCTYLEGPSAKVGTTYKYCYSSALRGGPLLFGIKTSQLFSGVFIMITAVTSHLVSGF